MRQAGRSLPGYREIRKRHSLFEVCRQPELCAEVTLEPVRVARRRRRGDVRGHHAAGARDGRRRRARGERRAGDRAGRSGRRRTSRRCECPIPKRPCPSSSRPSGSCAPSSSRSRRSSASAAGRSRLPATSSRGSRRATSCRRSACMYGAPEVWHALMEKLTEMSIRYLRAKVEAGADVVQLFDSWIGALSLADYVEFVSPYSQRILELGLRRRRSTSAPARQHLLETMTGDVIGIDWRAASTTSSQRRPPGVQGNLDPALLLGPFARRRGEALGDPRLSPAVGPGTSSTSGTACCPTPTPPISGGSSSSSTSGPRRSRHETRRRPHGLREPDRALRTSGRTWRTSAAGRPVSDEAVEELTERYRRIGGRSPLDDVTEAQRAALETELERARLRRDEALAPTDRRGRRAGGRRRRRHRRRDRARAALLEALGRGLPRAARGGARRPCRAALRRELAHARAVHRGARRSRRAGPMPTSSSRRTASRRGSSTRATRIGISSSRRRSSSRSGPGSDSWSFAFQSESPTGEPWLGPDILDGARQPAARAASTACSPARSASSPTIWRSSGTSTSRRGSARRSSGSSFERIGSLNDDPAFVRGLAELVRETVSSTLGLMEPGQIPLEGVGRRFRVNPHGTSP